MEAILDLESPLTAKAASIWGHLVEKTKGLGAAPPAEKEGEAGEEGEEELGE